MILENIKELPKGFDTEQDAKEAMFKDWISFTDRDHTWFFRKFVAPIHISPKTIFDELKEHGTTNDMGAQAWAYLIELGDDVAWSTDIIINIATECFITDNTCKKLKIVMDLINKDDRNRILPRLLFSEYDELREWVVMTVTTEAFIAGRSAFYKYDIADAFVSIIKGGKYKNHLLGLIATSLKNPKSKYFWELVFDGAKNRMMNLFDVLKTYKFVSAELYKITNDTDFLPETLRKIFLIKDKK